MKYYVRLMQHIIHGLLTAPMKTSQEVYRSLLFRFKLPEQVVRLQEHTRMVPLIIQIETINVCNARCAFCAYPSMKRKKGVMSLDLFERIITDYSAMGGGPVSFTPVVGDALLDPHLLERLKVLEAYPAINQLTLTTNGIALDQYSDDEVRHLLAAFYCIQVSIGGLDAATYGMLYGVEKFAKVREAMERLLNLKDTVAQPANITFAFRTNEPKFEAHFKEQLDEYRRRGAFISHICSYANYSGVVKEDEQRKLAVLSSPGRKHRICTYGSVAMSVCWDGTITACGCVDFDADRLTIGHAAREELAAVWSGEKRTAILTSFEKGRLLPICQDCSAYRPSTDFVLPHFNGIQPHRPLPLDFFRQFWGG